MKPGTTTEIGTFSIETGLTNRKKLKLRDKAVRVHLPNNQWIEMRYNKDGTVNIRGKDILRIQPQASNSIIITSGRNEE